MNLRESSMKNTISANSRKTVIRLFVYGTLKRGGWNHDRFCRNAVTIETATVRGRLYLLSAGFPALEIPESSILAYGTADPLADAAIQAGFVPKIAAGTDRPHPKGDWDPIKGELITFASPERDFPPIDRLEGFRPGSRCMYQRVLVIVQTATMEYPAWVYSMQVAPGGKRLQGEWSADSNARKI